MGVLTVDARSLPPRLPVPFGVVARPVVRGRGCPGAGSAATTYDLAVATFGSHASDPSRPRTCAGFLLRGAADNLAIRMRRSDVHVGALVGNDSACAVLDLGGVADACAPQVVLGACLVPELSDAVLAEVVERDEEVRGQRSGELVCVADGPGRPVVGAQLAQRT